MRGECLACSRIEVCSDTSVEKILNSYTCPLFEPIPAPIYVSRVMMLNQYGEVAAQSMMKKPLPNVEQTRSSPSDLLITDWIPIPPGGVT